MNEISRVLAESTIHHILDCQEFLFLGHLRLLALGQDKLGLTGVQILAGLDPLLQELRPILFGLTALKTRKNQQAPDNAFILPKDAQKS